MFAVRNRPLQVAVVNLGKLFNVNLQKSELSAISNHTSKFLVPKYDFEFHRYKSKSKKPRQEETESETEDDRLKDVIVDKNSKLMNLHVNSMRVDLLVKAGLGIARNKVETLFYEDKIRLNGQKVLKKSEAVQEGDEIDVIKEPNEKNPNLLTVARVEVLLVKPKDSGFNVTVRRCKSLLVDKYENIE